MKRLLAALLVGMLMGGALVNVLLGEQVDRLTLVNQGLQDKLASTEKELEKVKENLASRQVRTITAIEVHVTLPGKDIPELDQAKARLVVENRVREWLRPLLGQEVSRLDHLLIPRVVDRRQVDVDGRRYVLKVNLVVVAEKTILYLDAVPQKNNSTTGIAGSEEQL
ncbi:hypothetical protein GFC01_00730 [Desulfofundulus thermobenzoicus]|uniref:Sporulation membrane protein YtrI C-terminal domain-containing protein n=1 Tax=Desulfofundulus thermobenzoicus TaxID=29376 RepID=A0A6N7ILN2_9FIRM|nr:hypothetical protein [Desulfofundulus thermobenzoicus]MQL50824.1 hypothetical protein [Desulfofundulus thermobenzoicus]HHW44034.1 hypothetical protein [Desulfotomaculum sp.]